MEQELGGGGALLSRILPKACRHLEGLSPPLSSLEEKAPLPASKTDGIALCNSCFSFDCLALYVWLMLNH
ncbi:unnamed protein product [Spirodela intermedia]|uniref:Uncharacterized protein n=1 Tax=Spirodela intermedia TaxID=51605 RepID=A0A7I8IBJ9_SPIIN|nr:unnamed protein product [Spirodela intermedia]CAA6655147.1 unnamed protein product [Spirodela intermedia]